MYQAPEAGQLLAATGPVRGVSASIGADLKSAGRALEAYAAELREIKARLDALRAEAGAFAPSVKVMTTGPRTAPRSTATTSS